MYETSERKKITVWILITALSSIVIGLILWNVFIKSLQPKNTRYLQVCTVVGNVIVDRPGIGRMTAYKDMRLQSSDLLQTGPNSYLYLKLDDMYIMMEPETEIIITASGTEKRGTTLIYLAGYNASLVMRFDKPLSQYASFEMDALAFTRVAGGTIFRVDDGTQTKDVDIFSGKILYRRQTEEGQSQDHLFEAGTHIRFLWDQSGALQLNEEGHIDYHTFCVEVLEFLKEAQAQGLTLDIQPAELDRILSEKCIAPPTTGGNPSP